MAAGRRDSMTARVAPGARTGRVSAPPSKSQAHRALICAALSGRETVLLCRELSADIRATADCLQFMGAGIRGTEEGLAVTPLTPAPGERTLPCGESGSTLRFLLPLMGALGLSGTFDRKGRLPSRPLAPLDRELTAHGMTLSQSGDRLSCGGTLQPGEYVLPGDVSSQYISGLLMALPLLEGDSTLTVTGAVQSRDYIAMTEEILALSGIPLEWDGPRCLIRGGRRPAMPPRFRVEGDYSSAAFFLAMGALSPEGIEVDGLNPRSTQGDRRVLELLAGFGARVERRETGVLVRRDRLVGQTIDASQIPDLIPALSAVAALCRGETRVIHGERLRLKESDRLHTTAAMLSALGADIMETPDGLAIRGKDSLPGGIAESFGDHRIAMAAAVAACGCREAVQVRESQCVNKSYPGFWTDLGQLKEV